jgi:hypothetical protein
MAQCCCGLADHPFWRAERPDQAQGQVQRVGGRVCFWQRPKLLSPAQSGRFVSARQRPPRASSHVRTAHVRNGRSPIRLRGFRSGSRRCRSTHGFSPYSCPLARQTDGRGRTIRPIQCWRHRYSFAAPERSFHETISQPNSATRRES